MKKLLISTTALTLIVFLIPSVLSAEHCLIKDRDILEDGTYWSLWGGQWGVYCSICKDYELASLSIYNETHWKCPSCGRIFEKTGEWTTQWIPGGVYFYGREENGGWGACHLSQHTNIPLYPKENHKIYVKFKVGQMWIHGPWIDPARLADTGIWLWINFTEPQTVWVGEQYQYPVEISGVELSIFLDFDCPNEPFILPPTFTYKIRSETGKGTWLQVAWWYSKHLDGRGWQEIIIDPKSAYEYMENMGCNLQQGYIYEIQAGLEGHHGTAEAWYDYLDYCYPLESCGSSCQSGETPVCCCFNDGTGYYYWRTNECPFGERKVSSSTCSIWTSCPTACSRRGLYEGTIRGDACCCSNTPPPTDSCHDSDGLNYYTNGIVSGYDDGSAYSYPDYCSGGQLTEWYCSGTSPASRTVTCISGYYCSAGRCKRSSGGGGGGGCPTLFVYDGKEYKKERTSNIHSQEGIDTLDEIELTVEPVVVDGYYQLLLREQFFPGRSHVDSVKLFVDGEEAKLISAWHSKYGDVTYILKESDSVRTDTKLWDEIELKFAATKAESFLVKIEGYNPITGPRKMLLDVTPEQLSVIVIGITILIIVVIFGVFKFVMKKSFE